ncbi:UNVERIFIED_CONTAM: hypothetical protein Slati_3400500 [Sesamum latifolium]|uniref:Aminotransferase-like plant mobile domain-containing protein n=1 Tax=Sesamum latifolium TaxID=2727402 RepID=A0AAW2UE77_9LAMI
MSCLYDEVIPSALQLTGNDEKGDKFILCSNKYLLYAYRLLQNIVKVTKYHSPPPRKENKTVQPKSTLNSLSNIESNEKWSTADETLFSKLSIKGNFKEETYLVAYLACWLCVFVLPNKDVNSIRPSTFKMASTMASDQRVSLAIPALASIY